MTPSPFPGMDPYLEEPTRWPGVHARLITIIADMLAPLVAPQFTVAIEERIYIASPDDLTVESIGVEEIRERYLEVRDTRTRAVVTTIEVVSPANKAASTEGRRQFMQKRRRIMGSRTHWIEIDLLREGERPPEARGRGDYYALLRRGEDDAAYEIWAIALRNQLPIIAVPTIPMNADVPLDLQAVVETLIARGMYAETIDYDEPVPAPPLSAGDAQWLRERLEAWRPTRA